MSEMESKKQRWRRPSHMPGAEFDRIREDLGLNFEDFADKLNVSTTSAWRYAKEDSPIPAEVAQRARELEREALGVKNGTAPVSAVTGAQVALVAPTPVTAVSSGQVPTAPVPAVSVPAATPSVAKMESQVHSMNSSRGLGRAEGFALLAAMTLISFGSTSFLLWQMRKDLHEDFSRYQASQCGQSVQANSVAKGNPEFSADSETAFWKLDDSWNRMADGSTPAARRMPAEPFKGQKRPPCTPNAEVEKNGGCWMEGAAGPPCTDIAVEQDGKCYAPVPERKQARKPFSDEK